MLRDECGNARTYPRVGDPRNECHVIGVVERRCKAVEVGRDRRRSGPANAVTMSTRWPAQVERTAVTDAEGTPCRRFLVTGLENGFQQQGRKHPGEQHGPVTTRRAE